MYEARKKLEHLVQAQDAVGALALYDDMQHQALPINPYMIQCILSVCCHVESVEFSRVDALFQTTSVKWTEWGAWVACGLDMGPPCGLAGAWGQLQGASHVGLKDHHNFEAHHLG